MEHANCGLQRGVIQIGVKPLQIRRHDQTFVGHHPIRQTADVEIRIACQRHLGASARGEQLSEAVLVVNAAGVHKHLFDARQLIQRDLTTDAFVNRNFAPTKYRQTFCSERGLHGLAGSLLQGLITTKEEHADRVMLSQIDI